MRAVIKTKICAAAGLFLINTCCAAAICEANLLHSTQLEPDKYTFGFSVQMVHCPLVVCEAAIRYKVSYTELLNGARVALDRRYLFSARIGNGEYVIDDTVTVSASRFAPRIEDVEILGVSCP